MNKNQEAWKEERQILIQDLTSEKEQHFHTINSYNTAKEKIKQYEEMMGNYEKLANDSIEEAKKLKSELEEEKRKNIPQNEEIQEIQHKKIQELLDLNEKYRLEIENLKKRKNSPFFLI